MMRPATTLIFVLALTGCNAPGDRGDTAPTKADPDPPPTTDAADLILTGGRVYSLTWPDPGPDGTPADAAPRDENGWHPDASAVAIKGGKIIAVGTIEEIGRHRGADTRVVELDGATVLPGFIDSHAHIHTHGRMLTRVSLVGVETEDEAIKRIAERAKDTPKGEWIRAWGFDEGAWADRYPDHVKLSKAVPDHPVVADGLHGFASWGNQAALEAAKITADTRPPAGGEVVLGKDGKPTGILLNNASSLYDDVMPEPTAKERQDSIVAGLQDMASKGYVGLHEAGAGAESIQAFQAVEDAGTMPIRVYAMIRATAVPLMNEWIAKGPEKTDESMFTVRSVKAFYDASLGARGARLLADYADKPGHRGVSGSDYGFDEDLVAKAMRAGFQVGIHAIGDAGNRETLDFIERVIENDAGVRANRNRIEHAQIVHPDDQARFATLEVIASMEPPHMAEDMAWAEDRLGKERAAHGYAWRSLRKHGARLAFNSDLPGSDPNLFYGLHWAITRKNKNNEPDGGWFPDQALTPEEAVRGYTIWNAYAGFTEEHCGTLAAGKWADITIIDLDPFVVGAKEPEKLLGGNVVMTIVGGRVVYEKSS